MRTSAYSRPRARCAGLASDRSDLADLDNVGGAHSDGRLLSLVLYLNDAWDGARDGGALRIHLPEAVARAEGFEPERQTPYVDVYPRAGMLAVFRSDRVLHEVRPPERPRFALTVWLLVENPREGGGRYF